MQSVTSNDGTEIAYELDGDGPPVVIVHGGSGTRRSWDPLRPHLADEFTLVVPDRRGRGGSGDAEGYSLDREVADLRAVVDAVDGDPVVFGHSFGGLVSLEAARRGSVGGLVLYEPALLPGEHGTGADLADRMASRLDDGDRRGAMALFLREAGGVDDLDALPVWPDEVNLHLAGTVVRENRAVERYDRPDRLDLAARTLLLRSEYGPEHLRDGVRALHDALAGSRLVDLEGVGHVGTASAPGRVADAVRPFLRGESDRPGEVGVTE